MNYISVTEVRKLFSYDPLTGLLTWQVAKARRIKVGDLACKSATSRTVVIDYTNYKTHILCWIHYHGYMPELEIDHKDGNFKNNRIDNLRLATHKQNTANVAMHKDNSSGYKGVSRSRNKWVARIQGRRIGLFTTKEEAYKAYKKAAEETFGEFARV